MSSQTICRICNATILPATASQTGGLCMPCSKGTRYRHAAYLSIEEFFSKSSSDYCLAPNLEPHPSNADFKAALTRLSEEAGVSRCVIPVGEYEDADSELEPNSDRVFVAGSGGGGGFCQYGGADSGGGFFGERGGGGGGREECQHPKRESFLLWVD